MARNTATSKTAAARLVALAGALAVALSAGAPAMAQRFDPRAGSPFGPGSQGAFDAGRGVLMAQNRFDPRQNYSPEQARDARRAGEVIDARQARAIALGQHPGAEYLDLFLSGGGQPVYTVRLKTRDGRRVEVVLDARTGAVLRR